MRVLAGVFLVAVLGAIAHPASADPKRTYAERIADQASSAGVAQQKEAVDRDRARLSPPPGGTSIEVETTPTAPAMSAEQRKRLVRAGPACDEMGTHLRRGEYASVGAMLRHDPFREEPDATYMRRPNYQRAARWSEACKFTPAGLQRIHKLLEQQTPTPPLSSFLKNYKAQNSNTSQRTTSRPQTAAPPPVRKPAPTPARR